MGAHCLQETKGILGHGHNERQRNGGKRVC